MGLFSLHKESKPSGVVAWLTTVDTAYAKAYHCCQARELENVFDRDLLRSVKEELTLGGKEIYSGLDRYKHVTWVKISNAKEPTFHKKVNYDHVQISKGIFAPVGDDYVEEWVLTSMEEGRRVKSIRRLHD